MEKDRNMRRRKNNCTFGIIEWRKRKKSPI